MKTFTVTIHNSTNYGAWLQTYALQQAIESLGAENVVFDYTYEEADRKPHFRSLKQFLVFVSYHAIAFFRKGKRKVQKQAFDRFARERLNLSKTYHSMEELRHDPPDADVYITGSDQVWNFLQKAPFLDSRFLDFGGDSVRRVSYAASVANLNYTDEQKEWVKGKLSRFDAISLRERSAQEYIGAILGRETELVMDPVFLSERSLWEKLAVRRPVDGPYILCYQVQSCPGMGEAVARLKRQTGYKTVSILSTALSWIHTDVKIFDASPEEFVGLFLNAAIVVSASFHGTAFGLIFGKPTYAMTRTASPSRAKDLMQLCGTPQFCLAPGDPLPDRTTFDADKVSERIASERERSLRFLRKCLDK